MKGIQQGPETVARLHHDGFVTPAKDRPPQSVPRIDPPRVGILPPRHPTRQMALRSFQKQMIGVAHEHPRMNLPPRLPARLGEHLKKKPAVIVIKEDRVPAISSRHHVVVIPSCINKLTL